MTTNGTTDNFVTIVPVGESQPCDDDSAFVTVLSVESIEGASEITVHRPRGERLGLGLKFEGGSAASETVRRLLVQSCAEGSPSAEAKTPWGFLIPGDEILAIDGVPVSELTRIDCVRRLKDSDETLKLLVRHLKVKDNVTKKEANFGFKPNIIERPSMPPPVPPRKIGKRHSFKTDNHFNDAKQTNDNDVNKINPPQVKNVKLFRKSSFDSHLYRQSKDVLKRSSPEEVRRLVRRLSDGKTMPPQAEVYMDLISQEWERCLALADGESDDTGSSICTVVDRLSSKASSVENSIPSTPIAQHKMIDIKRVLSCIENIDADLLSETFMDSNVNVQENKISDLPRVVNDVFKMKPDQRKEAQKPIKESSETSNGINYPSNDRNNNHTIAKNITCINIEPETLLASKKTTDSMNCNPRPKPRLIKPDHLKTPKEVKTLKDDSEVIVPAVDELLTPTKKNCIETWLQRSEEELKDKNLEIADPVEDILPRLIDFVPKPHFIVTEPKVCDVTVVKNISSLNSPSSETNDKFNVVDTPREDGSGASLDTIGEDDESGDVTNSEDSLTNGKARSILTNTDSPNQPYIWNGTCHHKSDSEDKSLSNDDTPPTCPRQPPDGVETPNEIIEKQPEPVHAIKTETRTKQPSLPQQYSTTPRPRFSYSRKQDDRSECSVKDKIAMFSSAASTDQVDKCGLIPMPSNNSCLYTALLPKKNEKSLNNRFTKSHENLLSDVNSSIDIKRDKRPEVLGCTDKYSNLVRRETISELPIQDKTAFYNPYSFNAASKSPFKERIRSVSVDNGTKSTSTLEMLIEQRKKSMSKLRGLVLPENQGPIPDLPEIKVKENRSAAIILQCTKNPTPKMSRRQLNLKESLKNSLIPGNIPKYSPAFKRKSLQLFTIPTQSKELTPERYIARLEKPSRLSLDNNKLYTRSNTGLLITREYDAAIVGDKRTLEKLCKSNIYGNMEVKICTATEILDSDNDSAVSSTQSSYRSSASSPLHTIDSIESDSSHMSPRSSQFVPFTLVKTDSKSTNGRTKVPLNQDKSQVSRSMSSDTNLSASSSAGSGATSGSQASCSSLESTVNETIRKKVTRTHSIDSINRRNILASAKCRSGKDFKVSSPVVETKFTHESVERYSSPQRRSTERLSTLATNVSVSTNKGELRRTRSKAVAASDSDSEIDLESRNRKTDYKTTRARKHQTKNEASVQQKKQDLNNDIEFDKNEDTPEVITERILKEIKQAGLPEKKSEVKQCKTSLKTVVHAKNENEKLPVAREQENKFNLSEVNKAVSSPQPLKEEVITKSFESKGNVMRICLKRGNGAGVGLILAGGTDCEAKNVTIHKVLAGSAAEREGLTRGSRVISINGRSTEGLTHAESVAVLKEPRPEVIIVIEAKSNQNGNEYGSESTDSKECSLDSVDSYQPSSATIEGDLVKVVLMKTGGGAGLGFGLEGGKDSPLGDKPLTIKKLFAGGAASRCGSVEVGAELISAGDVIMSGLTRTQAWARLKDLPEGSVTVVLRNPKNA